jgi:predicted methyltransferase
VQLTDFNIRKVSDFAPAGSVDLVLTFKNLHNWREAGMTQMFKDAFNALKKGSALGIVEHQLPKHLA